MDVRIAPATPPRLGPLARVVAWAAGRATAGPPPHIFTTLGRHRRLFRSWIVFAATMLLRTRLPRADVELVILRTAHNCSSPYEWAQHAYLARKAGLGDEVVAAVPDWEHAAGLTDRQRLLLAATDELHDRRTLTQATWDRLRAALDDAELIELCMLTGHYEMLAMTLNSLGVAPEPALLDALGEGDRHIVRQLREGTPSA